MSRSCRFSCKVSSLGSLRMTSSFSRDDNDLTFEGLSDYTQSPLSLWKNFPDGFIPMRQKVDLGNKRNVNGEGRSVSPVVLAVVDVKSTGSNTWLCEMESHLGEVLLSVQFTLLGDTMGIDWVTLKRGDGSFH